VWAQFGGRLDGDGGEEEGLAGSEEGLAGSAGEDWGMLGELTELHRIRWGGAGHIVCAKQWGWFVGKEGIDPMPHLRKL